MSIIKKFIVRMHASTRLLTDHFKREKLIRNYLSSKSRLLPRISIPRNLTIKLNPLKYFFFFFISCWSIVDKSPNYACSFPIHKTVLFFFFFTLILTIVTQRCEREIDVIIAHLISSWLHEKIFFVFYPVVLTKSFQGWSCFFYFFALQWRENSIATWIWWNT